MIPSKKDKKHIKKSLLCVLLTDTTAMKLLEKYAVAALR